MTYEVSRRWFRKYQWHRQRWSFESEDKARAYYEILKANKRVGDTIEIYKREEF